MDVALVHQLVRLQHVVRLVQLGQVIKAPVVVGGGGVAPPRLHQADVELRVVLPERHLVGAQRLLRALGDVGVVVLLVLLRQCQVAGQQVGHQADVGQALDVGMPAQRVHATTGHADVAQQQLHHGAGTHVLCADRVLRPAQRVQDGHRLVLDGGGRDHVPDLADAVGRRAADALDHLHRVARVVLLEQVVDATRVLQRRVAAHEAIVTVGVVPAGAVVAALLFVVARIQAVLEGELVLHQERHVGVVQHVLVLDAVLGQQVVDQAAQEHDVGTGADRRVHVGHRGRAVEARIDHDQPGLVVRLGLGHPFEPARVGLGGIATHDQDQVGILDVDPVIRHRTTA